MPTNDEKAAFSKRLELALRRSPEPVHGATELALRFNLRHRGSAVSAQTAHKWLTGRSIPTHDKLETLADWLNVSQHWLHYGPPPASVLEVNESREPYHVVQTRQAPAKHPAKPSADAIGLALRIQALSPHQRYLVEELVKQLHQDVG
jgi:transcriptional regulator with XRE-family HTH domain